MAPIEERGAVWELDPSTMTWTLLSPSDPSKPFPPARSYHCSTSNNDDTYSSTLAVQSRDALEIFGLFNHPAVRGYNFPMHLGRRGVEPPWLSMTAHIYRMNGFDGKTELGGSLDIYDLASNAWSTKTYAADGISGPTPRSVSAVLTVIVGGRPLLMTLFGERDPSSLGHQGAGKMLGDIWAYDLTSDIWSEVDTKSIESSGGPAPRG